MITANISLILYITGAITMTMIFQFFWPRLIIEKISGLKVEGDTAEFFERHWGMAVFITGLLLVLAGYDCVIRRPVLFCVGLNKAVFVCMLLVDYKKGLIKHFVPTVLFDALCVVIFVAYLMGWA